MAKAPISYQQLASDDLFSLLGMESLPQEEKEELLEQMQQTVLARVYGTILAELNPDELDHFDSLHGEELMQFISRRGFNLEQMLVEESIKYRTELALAFQTITSPTIKTPAAA